MNKNRHRIIFNAARGHRMVVAETAGSHGGAAAGEAASGSTRSPFADAAIARSLTALAVLLLCSPAHPQIVADPSAPSNQRPTILQTANGLPQVNIQTPSAAGVSRNTYSRFDVQSNGAILNNSRTNVSTQLGGHIAANPWLATGEARVILNEVHSSHPSHLNGYVEVAGRRAEVIIANPSGIQVNGGGFINASGVTLTTGTAVMNSGHLDAFRVQGGSVNIEGLGLDTSTADYTTILTRAMQVNAGVWAKDLTVVTGNNQVTALATGAAAQAAAIAGTGAAPTFMLDVGALGGMYAGKIHLVGTEAGLGVNNRGSLIAHEGTWVLKTDGSLVNTGKVQAKGDLSIQTLGSITNTGDGSPASALISSQGHASIAAGTTVSNTAQAEIAASGTLTVHAGGALDNSTGTLAASQSATITSAALNNDKGLIHAGAALTINTQGHTLTNTNAAGHASAEGGIVAGGALTLITGAMDNTAGSIGSGGALLATVGQTNNTDGEILSAGTLDLTTQGTLTNVRGRLQAVGSSTIDTQGARLDNTAGRIASQANLALNTGELVNDAQAARAGLIGSNGDLTIHAGATTNGAAGATQSNIWSAQSASIAATSFTNAGVLSGSNISLDTTADVTNAIGASMEASGDLQITTTALLSNAGQLIANQSLTLTARDISNTGTLEATHQTLEATDTFTNAAGASITASDSIAIGAHTFNNLGLVNANETSDPAVPSLVHIQATTLNNTGAGAIFGDQIAMAATTLNNRPEAGGATAPVIAARQQLDLGVQTLNNEDGALIYSGGDMAIAGSLGASLSATGQAQAINNLSADIEVVDDLRMATQTLLNEWRNVSVSQVKVSEQTAELGMPSWWVNGHNRFFDTPIETTSNYTPHQFYLVNPASILSDTQLVTPDGTVVRRIEVTLDPTDSVYHAASGGYAGNYGVRERITVGSAATVVLYARLRQDGVVNPDQVVGTTDPTATYTSSVFAWQRDTLSYSGAYGRCTTNCTMLVVEPGYNDPQSTIVRGTHRNLNGTHEGIELTRTARQSIFEDRLNPGAGAPASIRAGANMRLDITNALTNRYADIQAGAVLDMQAAGAAVVNVGQTLKRTHRFLNTTHTWQLGSYDWTNPDINEDIGQVGGTLSGAQQLSITAQSLSNTDLARSTGLPTSGLGFLGVSLPNATAPFTVPDNALFQPASPGSNYLIESDPRFTDYRQWLGSDYMFAALGSDPNALQKRLGDGFYEQKLIREQVGQLTGRRFLEGHASDEAQFQALMDAGITYAQAHQLIPGVALSAEQMALLTTDLVWLVEREVVLPDGSKTKALVPQVYVRQVPQGDFAASGALLAGNSVSLQIAEDLVNAGGRIEGGVVVAQAGRDLSNIGGLMQARSELLASAGRNVTISSPSHTTSFSGQYVNQSRTELAGVGTMRVGNTNGAKLGIEAGGNVELQGASLSNAGAGGSTTIQAAGDVRLQTVTVGSTDNTEYNARNYQRSSQSREVGTRVQGAGSVSIQAGNDVTARAASVNAGDDLSVKAGNSITLEAGRAVSESESSLYTQRRGFLSKKSTEELRSSASDVALGSSFSGGNVVLEAGQDIAIKGSSVNAQDLLLLDAGRDVAITSEQNTESGSYFNETKKSGFSVSKAGIGYGKSAQNGSGSASSTTQAGSSVSGADVLIISGRDTRVGASTVVADDLLSIDAGRDVSIVSGVNSQTSEQASHSKSKGINLLPSGLTPSVTILHSTRDNGDGTSASTTAAASTVGSLGGDVTITAASKYQQTGSDVLALTGDIDIQARQVDITEARETRSSTSQQSSKSTVLGATPRNALVDAIKGAKTTLDTAQATAQTGNSRVQALGAAATALSAYNTANQVAELVADPGKIASVTIDFNLGHSKSRSENTETVNSGRGSTVAAAGDVRIVAKGAGTDSDILIRGSDVSAGNDATLKAEGDVRLESSQDRTSLHSTNNSSGASIGVGVSFGASNGITFNASANKARGNADGQDEIQRNTRIVAGNTARIESGADTTLAGASVTGKTVQAEVGGDLSVQSRQDTSTFTSDQKSSGFGVSLCIPPFCYGASSVSASGGAQNIESDFASVTEQSGLKAGDGGFQVNVQGDTTLAGGAITSTDKAVDEGRNSFATGGELTTSDMQNHARFEAEGYSVNVAVAVAGAEARTPEQKSKAPAAPAKNEGSAGIGEDSGEASSVTTAAISGIAGNTAARTGDEESGIKPIFDKDRVQQEIDAQIRITAEFGKGASRAIGDYAFKQMKQAEDLRTQANAQTDPAQRAQLIAQADQLEANWGDNGTLRLLAHTVVGGLTGGASGAVGAATGTLAAPAVADALTQAGIDGALADTLTALASTAAGALAGGAAGGGAALNEVMNNYLSHQEIVRKKQLKEELAQCTTSTCVDDKTAAIKALDALDQKRDRELAAVCQVPSSNACQSKQQEVRDFAAELVKVGAVDVIVSADGKHTLGQAVGTLDRGRLLIETGKGTVVSIAQGYGDLLDTLVDAAKDPAGAAAQLQQEAQQIKEAVEWAAQNPEKYDEIVAKAEQRLRDDLAAAIASGDEAAVGALLGSLAANFTPDPTRKAQSALKVLDEITLAKKADEVAKRADVDKVVSLPVGSKNNWDKTANGQLEPKTAYLLDNGHTYLTDTNGRVKEVGAELNGAKMDRNGYQQGCVGKCGEAGDEGGHLIAAALGGAGDRINIVPQAATLNRGDWRAMEREFAQALKDGKTVSMKIEVGYPAGGGERPSVFRVISVIDGRAQAPKIFNQ